VAGCPTGAYACRPPVGARRLLALAGIAGARALGDGGPSRTSRRRLR